MEGKIREREKKLIKSEKYSIRYLQNVKSNFLIGDNRELLDDDETC